MWFLFLKFRVLFYWFTQLCFNHKSERFFFFFLLLCFDWWPWVTNTGSVCFSTTHFQVVGGAGWVSGTHSFPSWWFIPNGRAGKRGERLVPCSLHPQFECEFVYVGNGKRENFLDALQGRVLYIAILIPYTLQCLTNTISRWTCFACLQPNYTISCETTWNVVDKQHRGGHSFSTELPPLSPDMNRGC